jgi:hypothetical protein
MYALILAMILTSPTGEKVDLTEPGLCVSYGVVENDRIHTLRIQGESKTLEELQEVCLPVKALHNYEVVHGCTMWRAHWDTVYAYWLEGNWCAEVHEACHAWYLDGHTARFVERWWTEPDENTACPEEKDDE